MLGKRQTLINKKNKIPKGFDGSADELIRQLANVCKEYRPLHKPVLHHVPLAIR